MTGKAREIRFALISSKSGISGFTALFYDDIGKTTVFQRKWVHCFSAGALKQCIVSIHYSPFIMILFVNLKQRVIVSDILFTVKSVNKRNFPFNLCRF